MDIDIVIEEFNMSDSSECSLCSRSYVFVNGELLDGDDHIKAILEHLGYSVNIDYR